MEPLHGVADIPSNKNSIKHVLFNSNCAPFHIYQFSVSLWSSLWACVKLYRTLQDSILNYTGPCNYFKASYKGVRANVFLGNARWTKRGQQSQTVAWKAQVGHQKSRFFTRMETYQLESLLKDFYNFYPLEIFRCHVGKTLSNLIQLWS